MLPNACLTWNADRWPKVRSTLLGHNYTSCFDLEPVRACLFILKNTVLQNHKCNLILRVCYLVFAPCIVCKLRADHENQAISKLCLKKKYMDSCICPAKIKYPMSKIRLFNHLCQWRVSCVPETHLIWPTIYFIKGKWELSEKFIPRGEIGGLPVLSKVTHNYIFSKEKTSIR